MDNAELKVYRGVAAVLAVLTFLGWGFSADDSTARNLYFILMISALTTAAVCRIGSYRSPNRWSMGVLYLAAVVGAIIFAYFEISEFGRSASSLSITIFQMLLLAWLARAAVLGDVKADV